MFNLRLGGRRGSRTEVQFYCGELLALRAGTTLTNCGGESFVSPQRSGADLQSLRPAAGWVGSLMIDPVGEGAGVVRTVA